MKGDASLQSNISLLLLFISPSPPHAHVTEDADDLKGPNNRYRHPLYIEYTCSYSLFLSLMTVSLILTHILGLMSAVIIVVVIVLSVTVTRHMKKTESLERELQSKVIVGTPERSEKNL